MKNLNLIYHNINSYKNFENFKKNKFLNSKLKKDIFNFPFFKILNQAKYINEIKEITKKVSNKKKQFILFGTGGSSLGARALINIKFEEVSKKIIFFDNIDPLEFKNKLNKFDLEKVGIIVISKSGNTPETLSQFACLIEKIKNNKNKKKILKECIIITENKSSPLMIIAKKNKCLILKHHSKIGGRYSVFSNVGLLPAHLVGLDISQIILGAKSLIQELKNKSYKDIFYFANIMAQLHKEKKININVLMTYSDSLYYFGKWYLQLWAESIGKKGKGLTPVHSVGTTDQHSQLQLYLDGPKDKFFSFITKNHKNKGLEMNDKIFEGTGINYLAGKSMGDLMEAEQKATIRTFKNNSFPMREINFKKIDEFLIGQLMTLNIVETITTCYLLDINPFDQPAVEQGKELTKNFLTKKI